MGRRRSKVLNCPRCWVEASVREVEVFGPNVEVDDCPRCGGLMDIERAEDVEVDVCLVCRGVWLDAGELEGLKRKVREGYELDEAAKESERLEEWWASQSSRGRNPLLGLFSRLR